MIDKIEKLLEKPCFVIDFLPKQVPKDSKGQYFEVEQYLLHQYNSDYFYNRFLNVILKIMCYYHIDVKWKGWHEQPSPQFIAQALKEMMNDRSDTIAIIFPDEETLLVCDWDSLNLAVYNSNSDMQDIMSSIARSEGLFWWPSSN